jgi:hypothetical protein
VNYYYWLKFQQPNLCALLPIEKINVSIKTDGVLTPFKTLSCLIGLGLGYDMVNVGSPCQVCFKNHECEMRLDKMNE